jgi:hypothetical protein
MLVDALVGAFGPFLIPAVLFVLGAVGYAVFVLLTRRGLLPPCQQDETRNR